MFKVGNNVILNGCPFDEQIPEEAMRYAVVNNKIQVITHIKDVSHLEGTSGQWVKTNFIGDWIDGAWFSASQKNTLETGKQKTTHKGCNGQVNK